jgi:sugar-specific transcriptional regulator TrmB
MHERELQQIGLTEKEAKVYLASLTLGKATANEISKKADLKRPTTYFTIDLLMEKGLVSSIHEEKKQYFMAESPERLVDVLHKREDELRREGEKLKEIIPDLKKLSPKAEEGPVVKYYKGKEGTYNMAKSLLQQMPDNETVYIIYPHDDVASTFTKEERENLKFQRSNKKTMIFSFYTSDTEELLDTESIKRHKLSKQKHEVSADIAVYGNLIRLSTFSGREPLGIVIEDRSIAETMRTLFKMAWKYRDSD